MPSCSRNSRPAKGTEAPNSGASRPCEHVGQRENENRFGRGSGEPRPPAYAAAMRVGIVGCGTAGQASSLLLHRAGHDVVVHERAAVLGAIGAGLLLQPTGVSVLREIGVDRALHALATPIERLHGVNEAGRAVLDVRYADLPACRSGCRSLCRGTGASPDPRLGAPVGWGVHRGALFSTLLDRMRDDGITINTGVACASYTLNHDGTASLLDERGGTIGVYDLLIIADGARSTLRTSCPHVRRATRYPWGAFWFVADDRDGSFSNTLFQVYRDTRGMIGFLPSGQRKPGEPRTVSVFWSVHCDDMERVRAAGLDAFKANVRTLVGTHQPRGAIDAVLSQITDLSQVIAATYQDVVLSQPNQGPVVFIGDAAHAMSPQLGQGANLALMDASVLARVIGQGTVPAALARYAALRRSHVAYYQFVSRWLTPIFQSDHAWLAVPRDALMGPSCGFSIAKHLMLETLVGVRTGLMPWTRTL
jgi:2-polyprenyl-6-methoxyphenol hydroxylase-like FAD-dependent oxidoreductase